MSNKDCVDCCGVVGTVQFLGNVEMANIVQQLRMVTSEVKSIIVLKPSKQYCI
jgi:hypothetical protein